MEVTMELIPRIFRDMNDGVLALDQKGCIIYMNPQSRDLLQLTENALGKTYAEVFFGEHQGKENDAFHQMVLDAVYGKEKKPSYILKDGDKVEFVNTKDAYDLAVRVETYDSTVNPATVAVGVNKGIMSRPWMLCLLVVIVCFAFGIVVICQKRSISNATVTQTDTGNVVVESAKVSKTHVVKALKNAEETPDDKVFLCVMQELKNDKEI